MKKERKEIAELERRLNRGIKKTATVSLQKFLFTAFYLFSKFVTEVFEKIFTLSLFFLFFVPIGLCLIVRKIFTRKTIFIRKNIYWLNGRQKLIRYFNCKNYLLSNAALLFHVLTFDLKLIGVSIKEYDSKNREAGDTCLYEEKPGVFNLWFLRSSSRIAHEGKTKIEMEYNYKKDFFGDCALIVKSIPAAFFHVSTSNYYPEINLLDITFCNMTMRDAVDKIREDIRNRLRRKIYFVNADCFNKAFSNHSYVEVLQKADYIFPDGIGVHLACKMTKKPLKENVNGTDMLPFLCRASLLDGFTFFLLGGKPGVAAKMKENLEKQYPAIRIIGEQDGYFNRSTETEKVIERIKELNPDVLLVAFGAPMQELWIDKYFCQLNSPIMMGVGGLFDFYSGNIRRAPTWMRETGLEWVFRLMMEPARMFRRYIIGNPLFIFRVIKWKSLTR
ncbi:MAG: WecB/TagA/CpsF family glycosyltransferase [Victivallaceae bacterium]